MGEIPMIFCRQTYMHPKPFSRAKQLSSQDPCNYSHMPFPLPPTFLQPLFPCLAFWVNAPHWRTGPVLSPSQEASAPSLTEFVDFGSLRFLGEPGLYSAQKQKSVLGYWVF